MTNPLRFFPSGASSKDWRQTWWLWGGERRGLSGMLGSSMTSLERADPESIMSGKGYSSSPSVSVSMGEPSRLTAMGLCWERKCRTCSRCASKWTALGPWFGVAGALRELEYELDLEEQAETVDEVGVNLSEDLTTSPDFFLSMGVLLSNVVFGNECGRLSLMLVSD